MLSERDGAANFSLNANGSLRQLKCPFQTQTVNNTERQSAVYPAEIRMKCRRLKWCFSKTECVCGGVEIKRNRHVIVMRYSRSEKVPNISQGQPSSALM